MTLVELWEVGGFCAVISGLSLTLKNLLGIQILAKWLGNGGERERGKKRSLQPDIQIDSFLPSDESSEQLNAP